MTTLVFVLSLLFLVTSMPTASARGLCDVADCNSSGDCHTLTVAYRECGTWANGCTTVGGTVASANRVAISQCGSEDGYSCALAYARAQENSLVDQVQCDETMLSFVGIPQLLDQALPVDVDGDNVPDALESELCGRAITRAQIDGSTVPGQCATSTDYVGPVIDADGDHVPDALEGPICSIEDQNTPLDGTCAGNNYSLPLI